MHIIASLENKVNAPGPRKVKEQSRMNGRMEIIKSYSCRLANGYDDSCEEKLLTSVTQGDIESI